MAFGFSDILAGVGLLQDLTGSGTKTNGGAGTKSASSAPWEPAQPYILRGLQDTATLNDYYQQNPFSDLQKKYYGQQFSDIDNFRNVVAPGLMNFANSGMTGGYQRGGSVIPQRGAFSLGPTYGGSTGGPSGSTDPFTSIFKPKTPTTDPTSKSTVNPVLVNEVNRTNGGDRRDSQTTAYDGAGVGFDTGPGLAAMGNLGNALSGLSPTVGGLLGLASDVGASLNNGYGALSGLDGYADARDAAAKGLGVGNTGGGDIDRTHENGGESTGGRDTGDGGRDASGGGDRGTRGGFAKGGFVAKGLLSGPDPEGPDDGAAYLDEGEYVIKKSAVKKIGKKKLDQMNKG